MLPIIKNFFLISAHINNNSTEIHGDHGSWLLMPKKLSYGFLTQNKLRPNFMALFIDFYILLIHNTIKLIP